MAEPMTAVCEHHYASHVRGGFPLYVRICMLCGAVDFNDLAEQVAAIRRKMAERVLLASEVARGLRCPVCHGKPAVQPHIAEKDPQYRCGTGHVWRRTLLIEDPAAHPEVLLARVAESGELPPIPACAALERTDT